MKKTLLTTLLISAVFPILAQEDIQWDNNSHRSLFADFNGDNIPDLLLQANTSNSTSMWVAGTGTSKAPTYQSNVSKTLSDSVTGSTWYTNDTIILPGRINDDAINDLLIIRPKQQSISWLEGSNNSPLTKDHSIENTKLPWNKSDDVFEYFGGDFNGDGFLDLLALSTEEGKHLLYHGTGTGNFTLAQKVSKKAKWGLRKQEQPIIRDFNGDGRDDIFALAKKANKKHYVVYADEKGLLKNKNIETVKEKFADFKWFNDFHSSSAQNIDDFSGFELLRRFNHPGGYDEEGTYIPGDADEEVLARKECKILFYSPNSKDKGAVCESAVTVGNLKGDSEETSRQANTTSQYEPTEPDVFPPSTPASKPTSSVGAYPAVNQSFTMSWNSVVGSLYYQIFHSTTDSNYSLLYSGTGFSKSTSYSSIGYRYFRYKACNAAGCSGFSPYYRTYIYSIPGTTSGVSVSPASFIIGNTASISWSKPSGIIGSGAYYTIRELRPNGSTATVKQVSHGSTSSSNVTPGSGIGTYKYQVQGCNKSSSYCGPWSPWSSSIVVTPPIPNAPTATTPTRVIKGTSFNVNFGSSSYATSYKIYENTHLIATVSSSPFPRSLSTTGLYSYAISACSSSGCSAKGTADSTRSNDRPVVYPATPINNGEYSISESVSATATASDVYGSVSAIEYKLDSGSWTANGNFGSLTAGNHTISYRAKDSYGDYSLTQTRSLSVTEPTATISNLSYPSVPVGFKQTFSFDFENATLCKASTGVIYYQGPMKKGSYSWQSPIRTTPSGNYSIEVTCSNSSSFGKDTVTTSVTPNTAPTATNDTIGINEGSGEVQINVLNNDYDSDNHPISVTNSSSPSHGSLRRMGGAFYYQPGSNFNGTDSFTYTISDEWGGADTAIVSISVTAVNDPPFAGNFNLSMNRNDSTKSVNVLNAPSTDIDGDTISISSITTTPSNGTAIHNGTNAINYTPNTNWCGTDTIAFKLTDGQALSNTGNITVNVSCANRPPSGTITIAGLAQVGATLSFTENIADADGIGSFTYQWMRGGIAITGAISNTYNLTIADIGSNISVKLSYTDGGGTSESITSSELGPIVNPEDEIIINNISFDSTSVNVGQSQRVSFSYTNATKCYDTDKPSHEFYNGVKTTGSIVNAETATRLIVGVQLQKITCENDKISKEGNSEYTVEKLIAPSNLAIEQ